MAILRNSCFLKFRTIPYRQVPYTFVCRGFLLYLSSLLSQIYLPKHDCETFVIVSNNNSVDFKLRFDEGEIKILYSSIYI